MTNPKPRTYTLTIRCECGTDNEVSCTQRQLRHIRSRCERCGAKIDLRCNVKPK